MRAKTVQDAHAVLIRGERLLEHLPMSPDYVAVEAIVEELRARCAELEAVADVEDLVVDRARTTLNEASSVIEALED